MRIFTSCTQPDSKFESSFMKLSIYSILSLLILINSVKANDSTELYKMRVQKIKELCIWLSKNTKSENVHEEAYYQYDSALNKNWKIFDSAIGIFYNKNIVDSIINNTEGQDNFFGPSAKRKMFKGLLSRFNELSHHIEPDSLKFKSVQTKESLNPTQTEKSQIENTIEQYFIIGGKFTMYLTFTFAEGTTLLTWIGVSEPPGEEGKKLYQYIQALRKKS